VKIPYIDTLPDTLFRFRPNDTKHFEDELHEAIVKHKTWLSPASIQNDPFDTNPSFTTSPDVEIEGFITGLRQKYGPYTSITGTDLSKLAKEQGAWNETAAKFLSSVNNLTSHAQTTLADTFFGSRNITKIACFSEEVNSILLWSHYANSHKGICFEYEVRAVKQGAFSVPKIFKVSYVSQRPKISTLEAAKYLSYNTLQDEEFFTSKETSEILDRSFFRKSKQWEYEREWRWVEIDDNPSRYHITLPLKVASITLGSNATRETFDICKNATENLVPLFQMKLSKDEFSFIREEV